MNTNNIHKWRIDNCPVTKETLTSPLREVNINTRRALIHYIRNEMSRSVHDDTIFYFVKIRNGNNSSEYIISRKEILTEQDKTISLIRGIEEKFYNAMKKCEKENCYFLIDLEGPIDWKFVPKNINKNGKT